MKKTHCDSHSPDLYSASPSRRSPIVRNPSGSLGIATLVTLLRSVSSLHWRSPPVLSIVGVWAVDVALLHKPPMFCPAVLLKAGSWNCRCYTRGFRLPWLMLWWRTRRAPSTGGSYHTGASSQHSPPVPRPVVLDVLAFHSWRCRPSR